MMSKAPQSGDNTNPFPGLRPFREEEDYLFFGRESQVDTMINKLAATKFLAVVGSSGSGKSSLVNCGLCPALYSGLMTRASTDWRIAKLRPGNDPLGALAAALSEDGVLFEKFENRGLQLGEIIDATLRMSKLGLIDAYEQSQLKGDVNLLVIVDQFEELFRYRKLGVRDTDSSNQAEAIVFVNLLLEAARQVNYPIYVVITMRSDFLGDCSQFQGLAEAINSGQYLVPRLSREERRAAIYGPIKVAGAEISPVLLTRLVNDVGDNPDQLSILQHALNRTWAYWENEGGATGPLELSHYQAIGTMAQALNHHAEKAYYELKTSRQRHLCEKVFKVLTDVASDPRGVRRPTTLKALSLIVNASEDEITEVIYVFRKPSRSFLMPPIEVEVDGSSVIDISHESLMRVWNRLRSWAYEEAQSAQMYIRLANTSVLHEEGRANLWRDPDLQLALDWRKKENPTRDWAMQYHPGFEAAMAFLQKSRQTRDYAAAEVRFTRKLRVLRTIILFFVLGLLSYNLWEPLSKKSTGEFTLGDNVINALRKQDIITLPSKPVSDLASVIQLSTLGKVAPALEEDSKRLRDIIEPEADGQEVLHIQKAIDKNQVWLSDVVVLKRPVPTADRGVVPMEIRLRDSLSQKYRYSKNFDIDEFDPIYILDLQRLRARQKDVAAVIEKQDFRDFLLKQGIVVLDESPRLPEAEIRRIRLVPNKIEVLRPMAEQSRKMAFVMQSEWVADKLLKSPTLVRPIDGILTIFTHFLGYFVAVFGFGILYRKLAFHPLGATSQHQWSRPASRRLRAISRLFGSRIWKVMFSLSVVLASFCIIALGVRLDWDLRWVLLGLTGLLLVPLYPLFRSNWAIRFKVAQGLCLQLGGLYLLIICILNSMDPVISLDRAWGLLFLGIGLIILGRRKCFLTAKEKLLRSPGRKHVLYFSPAQSRSKGWKGKLGRFIGYRYRTIDEKILGPVFGTLGPFIRLGSLKEIEGRGLVEAVDVPAGGHYNLGAFLTSSALVIFQIEDRLNEQLFVNLEQALEFLKPEQLLLYFSQQIDDKNLGTTYYQFVKETEGIFPVPFPQQENQDRLIAFKESWSPYLAGAINKPKIWWAKLLPFFARRIDIFKSRRSFVQHLQPFFEQRNLGPFKARLYSDFSIGLAGFYFIGLGIPAGIMIFRNYWLMKQPVRAFLGLIAPFLTFFFVYLFFVLIVTVGITGLNTNYEEIASVSLLILIICISPFATYWIWRRISGRKIRYQVAFSGIAKPWWKNILVIILTNAVIYGLVLVPFYTVGYSYTSTTSVASSKVWEGYDLASAGNIEEAVRVFGEAQTLDPNIDLNPYTEIVDTDPRKVASSLAAKAKVLKGYDLASRGDVEGAIAVLKEAQELDISVDLDPKTAEIENDAVLVVERIAAQAGAKVWEGYDLATAGNVDAAIATFKAAQELDPEIDLDPLSTTIEKDPYEVAGRMAANSKLREGYEFAKSGEAEKAEKLYEEARKLDTTLEKNANFWNNVGWWYSLGGNPEKAVAPSDKAVRFATNDSTLLGYCLDTRGLARALTGNLPGAIEDYERAMASPIYVNQEDYKIKRSKWVAAMKRGEQPFTEQVIQELFKE